MLDVFQGAASCGNFLPLFEGLLGAATGLLIAAIAVIVAAAILNNGFCTAPASPGLMVAAGVLTLAAMATLIAARVEASSYFQCVGAPSACAGALTNLLSAIAALLTVLAIQATACFVAAGIAWIPWVGAVPMYVILGALILDLALVPTTIAFAVILVNCVQQATAAFRSAPLIAVGGVIVIALATAGARYAMDWERARRRAGR